MALAHVTVAVANNRQVAKTKRLKMKVCQTQTNILKLDVMSLLHEGCFPRDKKTWLLSPIVSTNYFSIGASQKPLLAVTISAPCFNSHYLSKTLMQFYFWNNFNIEHGTLQICKSPFFKRTWGNENLGMPLGPKNSCYHFHFRKFVCFNVR